MKFTLKTLILDDNSKLEIPMRDDGYINATKLCKVANKRLDSWLRSPSTKHAVDALIKSTKIPKHEIIQTIQGGNCKLQGTWIHRQLATHLALWCSKSFAIQISQWIEEWITYNKQNEERYLKEIYNLQPDEDELKIEKLIQKILCNKLGGKTEVECSSGFIDLLTDNKIIEIKKGCFWKHAVGQILMYGLDYPEHIKYIYLFDMNENIDIINKCSQYNIKVVFCDDILTESLNNIINCE